MKVKICGQTRAEDIRRSLDGGADLCGVVIEVPSSPRSLGIKEAKPLFDEFPSKVAALTANASDNLLARIVKELRPSAVQLTADETPEDVKRLSALLDVRLWKSLHLPRSDKQSKADYSAEEFLLEMEKYAEAGVVTFILDTRVPDMYGGSGLKSDWELAGKIISDAKVDTFLAGGITPGNVLEAAALAPYGIDLASGVEVSPGIKSADKIKALFDTLQKVEK